MRRFGTISALALVTAVACGAQPGDGGSTLESSGSIGLQLQAGTSVTLASVSYEISGNGFHKSGTIDASGPAIKATVGGIPAGVGFSLSLTAVDANDASTRCQGMQGFDVRAGVVTPLRVLLRCQKPARTGGVSIEGSVNVCPRVDELSLSSAAVYVGGAIGLQAAASDDDNAPNGVRLAWSSDAGVLSLTSGSSTTLRCTSAGNVNVTLEASDGDCSDRVSTLVQCLPHQVYATVETTPVDASGDAADDPAVWVDANEPSRSVIIGTDKSETGGLNVYALDGSRLQRLEVGKLNNVDLREGFSLAGQPTTLVAAGNRSNNTISIFSFDAKSRSLSDVAEAPVTTIATYGSCMYKSSLSGKFYYFVDSKAGEIEQWELSESPVFPGKVSATRVRALKKLSSQPEACAVDDAAGKLYVGEEAVGVWKFDAEPSATSGPGWEGELIAKTGPGQHLVADVEGVAVVSTSDTDGYILVSNQGDNTYALFDRKAPHAWIKTFSVAKGASCIDEVTGSDGIEATARSLGPAFPNGVFVTQDDSNDGANQNFKLVPLEWISGAPPHVDASTCGGGTEPDPSQGGAGPGPGSSGWGTAYCEVFCQKCADCYATGSFSEGDCHYQTSKPNFDASDCLAGCAVSQTPGAAAHSTLPADFASQSCAAFDDAM